MNERIRELAWQAANGMLSYDAEGDFRLSEKEVEKFAELIVRECAEIVQEGRWMVPPSQHQLARSIKQHFGVK